MTILFSLNFFLTSLMFQTQRTCLHIAIINERLQVLKFLLTRVPPHFVASLDAVGHCRCIAF